MGRIVTCRPVRISIRGTSGSGKSTVGRAAADRLGIPYVELDAIRHQPNWVELPDEEFVPRVRELVAGEAWVVDGNYGAVREITGERATHIVWLDLPKWLTMWQITRRSVGRVVFRKELWNGNRESWRNLLSRDPLESIILWAWTTHARRRREHEAMMAGDDRWIRLRSRSDIRRWLASLEPVRGGTARR